MQIAVVVVSNCFHIFAVHFLFSPAPPYMPKSSILHFTVKNEMCFGGNTMESNRVAPGRSYV